MPVYDKTVWVNDSPPALAAINLNKLCNEIADQAAEQSISHSLPTWIDGDYPALTDAAPLNEMERVLEAVATSLGNSYSRTAWGDGWSPARNATNLNKMEQQAYTNRNALNLGTGIEIPTFRITQPAHEVAYWLWAKSATTQQVPSDSLDAFHSRCVVWNTAGGTSPALYSAGTQYFLTGMRMVGAYPGRACNWHNAPNDQPNGWLQWICGENSFGEGVSAQAIDCWGDSRGLSFVTQPEQYCGGVGDPNHSRTIFTQAEVEERYGYWFWIWGEIVWGRRSNDMGDAPRNGSFRIWVAGEDTPRVDCPAPRHTHYYKQHQISYVQGDYWSQGRVPEGMIIEHALTRFGRTPQECYEDVPEFISGAATGQEGGPGIGTHTEITSRLHNEAAIPSELAW